MFRKLVSGLPFSPALVGQLGFYARRLKQEEFSRRIGLILTALALIVQSFAVFSPPESANASSNSDIVRGGVKSKDEYLDIYDSGKDLKKILDYAGITREEISKTTEGTLNSKSKGTGANSWLSWGRTPQFSKALGESKHDINGTIVYARPLWRYDSTEWTKKHGSSYEALLGHSAKIGDFAILKNCGNLTTLSLPVQPAPKQAPVLTPELTNEKSAVNLTQGSVTASTVTAKAGDRIQYTVTMTNIGTGAAKTEFKETVQDVLEYATIYDNGGGSYNDSDKSLNWGEITLGAGETTSRNFTVAVMDQIPLTARGTSNPASYDCIMTNTFGNTISINVNCEAPKAVEQVVEQLPSTGPTENIIFAGIVASVVIYFYARSKQLSTEVRLIRRDFNAGTI